MALSLSDRIQQVKPSATLAVAAKAAELKAAGKDIIGLGTGEPDFDTPAHIKEAAKKAIDAGKTKYTPVDGIPDLKKAIIAKFQNENGLNYAANEILVSVGAKQCIFNLLQATINPGDEVLVPAPYWVSYPDMAKLAGGVPVIIETTIDSNFKITADQLEKAITAKTKAIFLNSPSNPTGVAYTKAELAALGEVLKKHPHIIIISDDIYEHIWWADEPFANILMACPELKDQTVVVNGVSKAFAMTGWRIGYAAGPANIIGAMKKTQGQSTSNPCSISQFAALEALSNDESMKCVADMKVAFKQRHDWLCNALNELPGFKCLPANGTFYSFPDVSEAMAKLGLETDVDFASHVLDKAGVAIVPGSAFGAPGCIRFSYATSMEVLEDAVSRIAKVL